MYEFQALLFTYIRSGISTVMKPQRSDLEIVIHINALLGTDVAIAPTKIKMQVCKICDANLWSLVSSFQTIL